MKVTSTITFCLLAMLGNAPMYAMDQDDDSNLDSTTRELLKQAKIAEWKIRYRTSREHLRTIEARRHKIRLEEQHEACSIECKKLERRSAGLVQKVADLEARCIAYEGIHRQEQRDAKPLSERSNMALEIQDLRFRLERCTEHNQMLNQINEELTMLQLAEVEAKDLAIKKLEALNRELQTELAQVISQQGSAS